MKLTAESADILTRLDGFRAWEVSPTMIRGAKPGGDALGYTKVPKKSKQKRQALRPEKPEPKKLDESTEISPDSFRRNEDGRLKIQQFMEEIYNLDNRLFESAPAFDMEGLCRLKHRATRSWKEILKASPKCIDCMFLSDNSVANFLRMLHFICMQPHFVVI